MGGSGKQTQIAARRGSMLMNSSMIFEYCERPFKNGRILFRFRKDFRCACSLWILCMASWRVWNVANWNSSICAADNRFWKSARPQLNEAGSGSWPVGSIPISTALNQDMSTGTSTPSEEKMWTRLAHQRRKAYESMQAIKVSQCCSGAKWTLGYAADLSVSSGVILF